MRVHLLAKQLNVPSKTIVEKCRAEGIDTVKNHMSTLSAGLQATILEWFSESEGDAALETADPVDLKKVQLKRKKTKNKAVAAGDDGSASTDTEASVAVAEPATLATPSIDTFTPIVTGPPDSESGTEHSAPEEISTEVAASIASPDEIKPEEPLQVEPNESVEAVAEIEKADIVAAEGETKAGPVVPAGPQHVPAPAKLKGPRVVRYEAPDYDVRPPRPAPRPPRTNDGPMPPTVPPGPAKPGDATAKPGDKTSPRRGRMNPRRSAGRLADAGERLSEWRDQDLAERKARLKGATGRRIMRRKSGQPGGGPGKQYVAGPKTEATVHEPIRMKEFCSETGLSFMPLFKVLRDEHNIMSNINMDLPVETAQLLALHFGIELTVVPAKTMLDDLEEEFASRKAKSEKPRPPVVTMLGHVDHGKTSLLDAIRRARVADGEDGGITQHISSYHIDIAGAAVTFLDTPGHEAFAEMRSRGAQVTDIVVLVVAADDGVMPQTVEAINHAKDAGVSIVVALNKIDLGDQNVVKIYGQLTEHGLTPSGDWGGEIDVIHTSAATGDGINELIEHLHNLASLLELKASPTLPAKGTTLEAQTTTGVGPVASVLVEDGTLRVGQFVVCGNAAGKIRALVDDRGRRVKEAGPSIPVEVWGLDDVPSSGDKLYQVNSLQRAKDIAEETKQGRVRSSRIQSRKVNTLQEILLQRDSDDVPELKVIIKGDVDGSLAALRQSLGELPSDEVKMSIRHAGVGAVNDSDVLLAAACNGLVVAFRVDTPTNTRKLAETNRVDIRSYRVIYDVRDDVKKALEGLLPPDESVESRGTAEVREVFRLSKKGGVIAGSFVTNGVIDRKHLVKVVRDGVVVRENATIASLRRFKDDAKEVRAGFECGIKVDGFDDIHAGDVVEAFEVVKTARTLDV